MTGFANLAVTVQPHAASISGCHRALTADRLVEAESSPRFKSTERRDPNDERRVPGESRIPAATPHCGLRFAPVPITEDLELVERFRSGDESAFDELVRRYRQRVCAVVYRLVRDPEDARELAQDAFVRVYNALPRFRGESSFNTWLYRIAVNCAINRLRSRRHRDAKTVESLEMNEDVVPDLPARDSPQSDYCRTRLREVITAAVEALPVRQKAVFVMRQYDGLTNREIAQVMRLTAGAVKAHYYYAVNHLQKTLMARSELQSYFG